MRRVVRSFAVSAVLMTLLASCGPRYDRSALNTTASSDGLSPGAPVADGASGPTTTQGSTTTGGTSGTTTTTGGVATSGGTTTGGATAARSGSLAGQTYRGVTATEVTIGIMASRTVNSAYEALGASDAGFPDPLDQVPPIVKWINDHGGVAGRKLKVAWHFRDDLSQDTDDAKMQQMCTDFVQDKKVFLVTSIYQAHTGAPCLADAGIPLIESGAGPARHGIPTYDDLGGYYMTPNQISMGRYARSMIEGIAKQGFFTGNVKVGLLYMGFPWAKAGVENGLKPALAKLGVKLTDEQEMRPIERASDLAGAQAEISNAVLRFKQKGINRVLGMDDQLTGFMTGAEQQDYYPRYGMGSLSLFGAPEGNPDSLKDSALVGTNVQMDVRPRWRGAQPAPEKTCRKIYIDSRQAPDDELAWGLMEWHCEGLFFIKAALDRMTELSPQGLIAAAQSLTNAYVPIGVYGMHIAPRHYDGASKARLLKFYPSCGCVKYDGPAYAIP